MAWHIWWLRWKTVAPYVYRLLHFYGTYSGNWIRASKVISIYCFVGEWHFACIINQRTLVRHTHRIILSVQFTSVLMGTNIKEETNQIEWTSLKAMISGKCLTIIVLFEWLAVLERSLVFLITCESDYHLFENLLNASRSRCALCSSECNWFGILCIDLNATRISKHSHSLFIPFVCFCLNHTFEIIRKVQTGKLNKSTKNFGRL